MKLLPEPWLRLLASWRSQDRSGHDPADMGTAFGLDSITVIDFEASAAPADSAVPAPSDWHRRLARRSRL